MHRLVLWSFVLAFVPLSLAVFWEVVILIRTALLGERPVNPTTSLTGAERSLSERI